MARSLFTFNGNLPALPQAPSHDGKISREVLRQEKHIADIAELTKEVMNELTDMTSLSAFKVATALGTFDIIVQAAKARGSSETEQELYDSLRREQLEAIKELVHAGSIKMITLLERLPTEDEASWLDKLLALLRSAKTEK